VVNLNGEVKFLKIIFENLGDDRWCVV